MERWRIVTEAFLVVCDHSDSFRTRKVASESGLKLQEINTVSLIPGADENFVFWLDETGLALGRAANGKDAATRVDFTDPTLQYRLRTSGKRQGLGKAVGLDKIKSGKQLHVLDATAGLGRDALLLAHLGCRVTLLEESPLIHALLDDGFYQAFREGNLSLQALMSRMTLHHANARDWMRGVGDGTREQPDVIYLDPMFPARQKSAKVKKDIALLHELLGPEQDLSSLVAHALSVAKYRVVLKRPEGRLPAELPEPAFIVEGKAASFAVYANSSLSNMP
jgi:16S rRNA (guanine1516-N2)-methyltransferase